eukprot:CAMPEP_0202774754 /NCGR_PEP_ID=MMETSP1388-20130828/47105_1 /ASSEMBLY_ACC=CAM_ASM_000864 /TAXON_ID=37098 /ORGANISM="Isochrysis sp, Strain CCMP1244" /LENGTH=153 /DNA_ID=CAMNT_0049443841 /DNA_START=232 /DNA_END=691 /DNA_ORIENTATION=+
MTKAESGASAGTARVSPGAGRSAGAQARRRSLRSLPSAAATAPVRRVLRGDGTAGAWMRRRLRVATASGGGSIASSGGVACAGAGVAHTCAADSSTGSAAFSNGAAASPRAEPSGVGTASASALHCARVSAAAASRAAEIASAIAKPCAARRA